MSNEMDEDWFGTEPAPVPAPGPTSAPETTSDAPGAKTADDKSMEGKAEEWFSKPSTSTKNGEEAANEDWFAKAPAKKPKADPKKNLAAEVESPPPKIPIIEKPAKEEDSENWFAKVPVNSVNTNSVNPADSKVTLVKSKRRKESYMYGYISKVMIRRIF